MFDQSCPVRIELCCSKTALIHYKGIMIGKVERLISRACSSENRFQLTTIDPTLVPMVLIPVKTCSSILDCFTGGSLSCYYPRTIEVLKNDRVISIIKNSETYTCCTVPCKLHPGPYNKGEVRFSPEMKTIEKVLLVVGWIIQHGYMTR